MLQLLDHTSNMVQKNGFTLADTSITHHRTESLAEHAMFLIRRTVEQSMLPVLWGPWHEFLHLMRLTRLVDVGEGCLCDVRHFVRCDSDDLVGENQHSSSAVRGMCNLQDHTARAIAVPCEPIHLSRHTEYE